jgi:hypothetical protein
MCGRVAQLLSSITYRIIKTPAERESIFQLRYNAYLREGAIVPRSDKRLCDQYDEAPNAITFGIYIHTALVSSIRLNIVTSTTPFSPALSAFPDVLAELVQRGLTIIDPNRLIVDPELGGASTHIAYVTTRLGYMAGIFFNADIITATVRKEHRAFYSRVFLMTTARPPRAYSTLIKPLGLMTVPFKANAEAVARRYPFFVSTQDERESLFGEFSRSFSFAQPRAESLLLCEMQDHLRAPQWIFPLQS